MEGIIVLAWRSSGIDDRQDRHIIMQRGSVWVSVGGRTRKSD